MPPDQDAENKFDQLREKAEALIRERPEQKTTPLPGILDLIHELHIHQAELAIQNEELQRAQQELSELHQEYENLYEFAPCGYLSLNSKGIIIRINLAGVTLLQAMRKQVLHTGFSQFLHADYEDIYLEALQKAGQTGEKQFIELRLARAEDSQFWVWAEIQADRCINDSVKQWLMTLVNISSKKQAESILQASNKKYQRLFHEMVGGALLLSVTIGTEKNYPLAASVLEANGAFERLTGVQSRQVVGRPMDEIWPLADTVWADQLCKALSAQTPIEINGPHREKSQQFFLSAFWVDDCQVGITFTDISAQKTIEWTLCEIRQDLARQVKEQTAELRRTNKVLLSEVKSRKQAQFSLIEKSQELEVRSEGLREANAALKVLLQELQNSRGALEEKIYCNLNDLIRPYLSKIGEGKLNQRHRSLLEVINKNLDEIVSPLNWRFIIDGSHLTPTETQVAHLIRQAKSSKEIAELLGVANSTIDFHRLNIRRKLHLTNKRINLQTYLRSLE